MKNKNNHKKLKIVHIITKLELGGAQVNTIHTYENLDNTVFEPYLISGPGGILTDKIKKKDNLIIIDTLIRQINPLKDLKTFLQLRKILKEIKPDVIHTHSSKAGILGRIVARSLKIPVIIHSVHGFSFSPFQSFLRRTFFTTAERLTAKITRHFIFVAKDDIEIARKNKVLKKKENFSLIRSGFPFGPFLAQGTGPEIIRQRFNISPDDFVIGIIAPFKPQKGLFHLVEIAALVLEEMKEKREIGEIGDVGDIVFLILGDGDLRGEIEAKLKEKGIFEYFRLPGFVFDVHDVIGVFDLGVSTALWEGLPQSLVQMRLKGKAVVASDICGNREVINDGVNGYLVDVLDYRRFAERVGFLVENDGDRERLAGHTEDYSCWDADFMVTQQEKLYKKLINETQ